MDAALHHLTDQIRAAAAAQTPLCIRGHGSKEFYGEPPQGERLDTTACTGIVSYEPSELVITVRAGTPLLELEAALAEQGQCLAFEPPRFAHPLPTTPDASSPLASAQPIATQATARSGTCGGMVAAGLSGPARASVGGVRDYVLGVQLINGRAEHLTFGGQVMKNVAGYDVSRLMVGALGCLGVLTEISLKVLPVAPAEATLVFELDQARALAQLHRWGAQPLPLNASCWVCDDTAPGAPQLLFVRLRGAAAAVDAAIQKMTQEVPGTLMDNTQAGPDWQACRDQRLPFFTQAGRPASQPPASLAPPATGTEPLALWRLSLPQTTPALDLPWAQLVEWHGGLRWLWAPESAQAQLREVAAQHGGNATLFIAPRPSNTLATNRFDALKPVTRQIHQRLKAEFDPAGIFNPGRMGPGL
jgi:glycolate oxidase FAD binding subunit